MKRFIIYAIFAMMLSACTADEPAPIDNATDTYEMKFNFTTYSPTRVTGGIYSGTLPMDEVSLSTYFTDELGESQYYFKQLNNLVENNGVWTAPGWYWPLQGKMTLFNYWIHSVGSTSELDKIEMPDGTAKPVLKVNGRSLDGYHDFIYGAKSGYQCPQATAVTLPCYHALAWLKLRLYTYVYKPDGVTYDAVKSTELKNRLTVHKISIENCSRKGDAVIMPDKPVAWNIPDESYIKDQLYRQITSSNHGGGEWIEVDDASVAPDSQYPIAVNIGSTYAPYLGLYSRADDNYSAWGLLIVPQHKTAIVIDYTLELDGGHRVRNTERFELRENGDWLPGSYYDYDIVFRNYSDLGVTFDLIPTWGELNYDASNRNFDNGAFGSFVIDENGTPVNWDSYLLIDPMHDAGSATGDDMDYKKGGTVF